MAESRNLLRLHEAIIIALINIDKDNFQASFEEIAQYINEKKLYFNRKGNISLSEQIKLRTTQSKGRYAFLFKQINNITIQLCLKPKTIYK